jgi:hypothetical protein
MYHLLLQTTDSVHVLLEIYFPVFRLFQNAFQTIILSLGAAALGLMICVCSTSNTFRPDSRAPKPVGFQNISGAKALAVFLF